ncbi:glycine cleavage system protein GcvH [Jeotgalibaca caeni]|uniref:glycine cleavage system protein GcvH n=1 Tax=Jeotgalibaca caeni TaxID=3028623 RepID=UPI00237E5DD5|nr:glycine cleavage system protein GcvH [Jeotgalibaca caeni]MDE1549741.1 glycine cleavage system protein GcvH [Jeotgalibaca caeni]
MMYYTSEHEWLKMMDETTARVGITDHAQAQLGDIVFVDYTASIGEIAKGEEVVTVESVKSVSDVYAPVSGTITAFNDTLADRPETVNESAITEGWMFEMELSDLSELKSLLSLEQYEALLEEEE